MLLEIHQNWLKLMLKKLVSTNLIEKTTFCEKIARIEWKNLETSR